MKKVVCRVCREVVINDHGMIELLKQANFLHVDPWALQQDDLRLHFADSHPEELAELDQRLGDEQDG